MQGTQASQGDLGSAGKDIRDKLFQDLSFIAQELCEGQHVSFSPRVDGTQRGHQPGANTAAGESILLIGLVLCECKLARAAICGGIGPGERK
jgi:hypothetical protein